MKLDSAMAPMRCLFEWPAHDPKVGLYWASRHFHRPGLRVWFFGRYVLALILAILAIPALAQEPPVHVCVTTGGAVVLSGEASAVTPTAHISVRGPIVLGGTADGKGKTPLGFGAELELTGLPGATVDAGKVDSIRALELTVSIERVIGRLGDGPDAVRTALYIESGFTTRLPHTPAPLDQYPRWLAVGVRLATGDNYFAAGLGTDQRLDGTFQPAALVSGQVGIPALKNADGTTKLSVLLRAAAILGLTPPGYGTPGARSDVVRLGVVIGR